MRKMGFWRNLILNFSKIFDSSLKYIKESRNYIYFVIILFFFSAIIGFFFPDNFRFIDAILKEIAEKASSLKGLDLIIFIFDNNIRSAFLGLILGVLLGVFPFINALSNGIVLGYVFSKVWQISGFADFWRILPHGIFELPAIFIALGIGIKLGMFVFSNNKMKEFKYRFWSSLKAFVSIIAPLLIIAAIIEGLLITLL
jgi:stage II sporulation protein M